MFEDLFKLIAPPSLSFEKDWPDFRMYAISRHGTQMYGDFPYAYHLAMVECILAEYGFTEFHYQAAAWLHDVIEDTGTKLDGIYHNYGPLVTSLVYSVTGEGKNRKERNASIYAKLKKCPEGAVIKVADRIANMTSSKRELFKTADPSKIKMYLKEWPEFQSNIAPLIGADLGSRLIWEDLESTVIACQEELDRHYAATKETDELLLTEKKRENAESAPSLGQEE